VLDVTGNMRIVRFLRDICDCDCHRPRCDHFRSNLGRSLPPIRSERAMDPSNGPVTHSRRWPDGRETTARAHSRGFRR
jgi:hypothetical protein